MVYLFLCNYAAANADLTLLAINTLQKDWYGVLLGVVLGVVTAVHHRGSSERRALTTPPRCCWAPAVRHRARRSLSLVSCGWWGTSNG